MTTSKTSMLSELLELLDSDELLSELLDELLLLDLELLDELLDDSEDHDDSELELLGLL